MKEVDNGDGAEIMNTNHLLKKVKERIDDDTTNYKRVDPKCGVKVIQRLDEISEKNTNNLTK